jgi:hypothetical protein
MPSGRFAGNSCKSPQIHGCVRREISSEMPIRFAIISSDRETGEHAQSMSWPCLPHCRGDSASFDEKSTRRPRRLNSERRSVISESNDYPHGRQSMVT